MLRRPTFLFPGDTPIGATLFRMVTSLRPGVTPRAVAPSKAKAKAARIRTLQRQARRIQRQAAR